MTLSEYYEILRNKWEQIDKDNLQEIKWYNEFKRQLRKELAEQYISGYGGIGRRKRLKIF